MLWGLHKALAARNVAPCVRWPACVETQQAEFITLLADLHWVACRWPEQRAAFKGWRNLLAAEPGSNGWHEAALRQYLFVRPRLSLAHWCATGLALSDEQRQDLMMLPTNAMRAERRQLGRFETVRQCLLDHAIEHPDRAGRHGPAEVAERRAQMWRVYLLAGRSPSRAATYWAALTGEGLSRQAFSKQVSLALEVLRVARRDGAIL